MQVFVLLPALPVTEDITDDLWDCFFNKSTIKIYYICGINSFVYLCHELINNCFSEIFVTIVDIEPWCLHSGIGVEPLGIRCGGVINT